EGVRASRLPRAKPEVAPQHEECGAPLSENRSATSLHPALGGSMRFGLIGFGAWGKFHAEAIRKAPRAELAAIACATEASAAAAREKYAAAAVHQDWRALLADRSIDAVDIVVPNHLHADIAVAALEAGK